MALPAFFLDLEAISKIISCGNLTTYSFVTACGIALRFRDRDTQITDRSPNEVYVWLFLVSSFVTSLCFTKLDNKIASYTLAGLTLALLIRLMFIPQPNQPRRGHYRMPLVPLLPAVGIQFNFILAAGLDAITWAYFLAFVAIGLVIYFSYSIRHSHLEPQNVMRGKLETSLVEGSGPMHSSVLEEQEGQSELIQRDGEEYRPPE